MATATIKNILQHPGQAVDDLSKIAHAYGDAAKNTLELGKKTLTELKDVYGHVVSNALEATGSVRSATDTAAQIAYSHVPSKNGGRSKPKKSKPKKSKPRNTRKNKK